jgi:hypothetical protein
MSYPTLPSTPIDNDDDEDPYVVIERQRERLAFLTDLLLDLDFAAEDLFGATAAA